MANTKKRCRYCKEWKPVETMLKVPLGAFCNVDHAYKYAAEKSQAKRTKEVKRDIRQKKETLLTARDWIKKAQAAVNPYIRLRDKDKPCISCGGSVEEIESEQGWKVGGCWDAGHYRSRGAAGHLRFNVLNISKQCKRCNGGSGKHSRKRDTVDKQYRINLIAKIGEDKVLELDNNNEIRRFDINYLKRLQKIFLKRSRHLKKLRGST
jgi:hypothetical protein